MPAAVCSGPATSVRRPALRRGPGRHAEGPDMRAHSRLPAVRAARAASSGAGLVPVLPRV